ncbi:MAG: hypothetical protein AABX17_00390 [Nanoarchaeota archaeon]
MADRIKARVVIPNVDDYWADISVLRVSNLGYEIITPRYDNTLMGGRVLRPINRRRLDE